MHSHLLAISEDYYCMTYKCCLQYDEHGRFLALQSFEAFQERIFQLDSQLIVSRTDDVCRVVLNLNQRVLVRLKYCTTYRCVWKLIRVCMYIESSMKIWNVVLSFELRVYSGVTSYQMYDVATWAFFNLHISNSLLQLTNKSGQLSMSLVTYRSTQGRYKHSSCGNATRQTAM